MKNDVEWAGVPKLVAPEAGSTATEPTEAHADLKPADASETISEPLPRIHDSKIHHVATDSDQPSGSREFVNSVVRQEASSPAAVPVLAAGAADEISTQPGKLDPTSVGASNIRPLQTMPQGKTSYLISRTMSAGPLVEQTEAASHIPTVEEQVLTPTILPTLYNRRGRLVMPPAMKGTREILVHQNTMANSEGLTRIQDDADLARMRSSRLLVALPQSSALHVDERLPGNRRYCRPWTEVFLANLARAHYARFHTPLQVNSAVRTVAFQERLIRTNGNAAPAEGLTASPHLTGQAVDLAKHGLSLTEIAWLRGYLMPLVQEGKIDVEEEFQQSCFHISVYKGYLPEPAPQRMIAEKTHHATSVLGAVLR